MATKQHSDIVDPNIHEPKGVASAAEGTVYLANGTGSGSWSSLPGVGTNIVTVNDAQDFPNPVSGVITLAAGITYEIHGNINIGTDRIVFSAGSAIVGTNRFTDFITYTGTGTLFTAASVTHKIEEIGIIAALGTVFSLTSSNTNTAVYTNSYIVTCANVGSLSGWGIAVFRSFSVVACSGTGLTFSGTQTAFNMDNSLWQGFSAGNSMLDFGTATFDRIQVESGNRFVAPTGVTALSGAASSANINSGGFGGINGCLFTGDGTYLSGINPSDIRWTIKDNSGVEDSKTGGRVTMITNSTDSVVSSSGTYVLVGGTWDVRDEDRVTATTAGRLTYDGEIPLTGVKVEASCSVEPSTVNNRQCSLRIVKNGDPTATEAVDTQITAFADNNDPIPAATCGFFDLDPGDYIELWTTNDTDTDNIVVTNAKLILNEQ